MLGVQVPQQVFTHVADAAHAEKHRRYAVRSFVEDNRRLTWCPAPGCEHAVESLTDTGPAPLDVVCRCGSAFCFNCKEEAHRPVRAQLGVQTVCDTVSQACMPSCLCLKRPHNEIHIPALANGILLT